MLGDRLRECARSVGGIEELSRRSGIPRKTIDNYLTSKSEPKASTLVALAKAADVTLNWLLTGVGPRDTLAGPHERDAYEDLDVSEGGSVADRVRQLLDRSGARSEREFAQRLGLPYSTLKGVLDGNRPSVDKVVSVAKATGTSLEWLATGTGAISRKAGEIGVEDEAGELHYVPRYDVQISAGNGLCGEDNEPLERLPFARSFFAQHLRRKPGPMVIVTAAGDSMVPTIADGDLVMIDTSDQRMVDGIWAYSIAEQLYVKRLQFIGGDLHVYSDNADRYPGYELAADQRREMRLIGRVVWIGHRV